MSGKSCIFRVFMLIFSSDLWLWTCADVYYSTFKMEHLLETRQKVISDLQVYINKEESRLKDIQLYLQRYETEKVKAKKDRLKYVGNPINAFTLIKRLTSDLDEIEELINKTTEFPSRSFESSLKENSAVIYPKPKDMIGAALAIARLQRIYKLSIDDLANGVINGVVKSQPMTWSDCHKLGLIVYIDKNDNINALAWQLKALKKLKLENGTYSQKAEITIMETIAIVNYYLDDLEAAADWLVKILMLDPHNERARRNLINTESTIRINRETDNVPQPPQTSEDKPIVDTKSDNDIDWEPINTYVSQKKTDLMYEALCRGEYELSSEVSSRLTCRYLDNKPFLRLAPFKMEQMYIDPDVYLFHDVISDKEIAQLQEIAKLDFEWASVADADDPSPDSETVDEYRISQVSWLPEYKSEVLTRLSRRISDFSGLRVESFENLQVSNYGVGGRYELYFDCYPQSIPNVDNINRIATALFYLSDVNLGGSTVFPLLGLSVPPKKGSALLWMNLHPSGEMDQDTMHASCPVLDGSKWIAHKWIRLLGHELVRPCTLDYQQEDVFRDLPAPTPVLIN